MWFRHLQVYRLTDSQHFVSEQLHEALEQKMFTHCRGLDTFTTGWVSPLGKHGRQLVHATNGCLMVCMRREERILPAQVIREAVEEKVDEIECRESRKVSRKQKSEIRDEVIVDLLPRAFTKSSHTYAYLEPRNNRLIIDCTSSAKAEELVTLLRESLGSLKAKPLAVQHSPADIMTDWVINHPPAEVEVNDECELKETVDNGAVIRIRGIDLHSQEVQQHVKTGKIVSKVAMQWQERLSCVLHDDLSIKKLKFMDVVTEASSDTEADDETMRFDADFALMSLELSRFIPALSDYFGGLDES